MDHTCIEKNTVSGIRLIGQKYQAKLVLEPAKLLGAWRRCLHASADSRTGVDAVLRLKGSGNLDAIQIIKIPGGCQGSS